MHQKRRIWRVLRKYKIFDDGKSNSKGTKGEREHEAIQDQMNIAEIWGRGRRGADQTGKGQDLNTTVCHDKNVDLRADTPGDYFNQTVQRSRLYPVDTDEVTPGYS